MGKPRDTNIVYLMALDEVRGRIYERTYPVKVDRWYKFELHVNPGAGKYDLLVDHATPCKLELIWIQVEHGNVADSYSLLAIINSKRLRIQKQVRLRSHIL